MTHTQFVCVLVTHHHNTISPSLSFCMHLKNGGDEVGCIFLGPHSFDENEHILYILCVCSGYSFDRPRQSRKEKNKKEEEENSIEFNIIYIPYPSAHTHTQFIL